MAPGTPPPAQQRPIVTPARRHRAALPAVLLLAFAVRLGWVLLATLDPSDGTYYDMAWYHISAAQLAAGNGLSNADGTATAKWPPTYPALIAAVYVFTGPDLMAGRLLNPFLGVLTTLFTYLIGRCLLGPRCGLLAALLFAVSLDNVFFSNFVMSEVAFGAIFTGTVWLFVWLVQRRPEPHLASWIGMGLVLGLTCLTRGIALAWVGVAFVVWALSARALKPALVKSALVTLGIVCVIAPWTARNTVRMGYPVAIATSIGMVLANAHSPWETGGPSLKTVVYQNQFRRQFEHLPPPQREVAEMRGFTRVSLQYLVNHPGHELRLVPARIRNLFLHGHEGLKIGRKKLPDGNPEPFFSPGWGRLLAGGADVLFFGLLGLGLAGLPFYFRASDRIALVVPLTLLYFASLHLVIFPGNPRYHLPMAPFLALSASALLGRWLPGWERS
jgi:4-amino-4-deoxy-L-arabinose transferase-like glycosyltransferase